ncbi:hypothetical protein VTK56DRAFT_9170 [Thermocarpiscus australiensis]
MFLSPFATSFGNSPVLLLLVASTLIMNLTKPSTRKASISYADAARGLRTPAPKPLDNVAEFPRLDEQVPVQSVADVSSRRQCEPGAGEAGAARRSRGPVQSASDVSSRQQREPGPEAGAIRRSRTPEQPVRNSTVSGASENAKPPPKFPFSYAEAVRGKITMQPKKVESSPVTEVEALSPAMEAIPEADAKEPEDSKNQQPGAGSSTQTTGVEQPSSKGTDEATVRHSQETQPRVRSSKLNPEAACFASSSLSSSATSGLHQTCHRYGAIPSQGNSETEPSSSKCSCDVPHTNLEATTSGDTELPRVEMADPSEEASDEVFEGIDISLLRTDRWDVLVKCGNLDFRVHRALLCQESDYFREELPPDDPHGGYVTFDLTETHSEEHLAAAIDYMYSSYAHGLALGRPRTLQHGAFIRQSVFMYVAGASIDYPHLMDESADVVEEAADTFKVLLRAMTRRELEEADLSQLYLPLREALILMYVEGHHPVMTGMRLAMAKLIDLTLMYMILNPGFREELDTHWCPWIYQNILNDNLFFSRQGLLPQWDPSRPGTGAAVAAALANMRNTRAGAGNTQASAGNTQEDAGNTRATEGNTQTNARNTKEGPAAEEFAAERNGSDNERDAEEAPTVEEVEWADDGDRVDRFAASEAGEERLEKEGEDEKPVEDTGESPVENTSESPVEDPVENTGENYPVKNPVGD